MVNSVLIILTDSSVVIDLTMIELVEVSVDIDIPAGGLDISDGVEVILEVSEASEQELQNIIDNSLRYSKEN